LFFFFFFFYLLRITLKGPEMKFGDFTKFLSYLKTSVLFCKLFIISFSFYFHDYRNFSNKPLIVYIISGPVCVLGAVYFIQQATHAVLIF